MIPQPGRSVFPKNRTWFALLMVQKTGRSDIYPTLFFTEQEATTYGLEMKQKQMLEDFKVYPVRPQRQDSNYKPLWY